MAATKVVITLEYENEGTFEMKVKKGDAAAISIVRIQENSNVGIVWPNVAKICEDEFVLLIAEAGEVMKA